MLLRAGSGGYEQPFKSSACLGRTKASMTRLPTPHQPVLPEDCLKLLDPRPGYFYFDGTIGTGAHSRLILESAPGSIVFGFDRDADALRIAESNLSEFESRVILHHDDFKNWRHYEMPDRPFGGCLLDLGFSSVQIESSGRGFSFSRDEPLDMRMDIRHGRTGADILNELPAHELVRIFQEYGEVPFSRRLAAEIVARRGRRSFARTADFLEAIFTVAHPHRWHHPATLPFMALRIAVNGELDGLDVFLRDVAAAVTISGRVVVISFHSLEDRIVKHTFRSLAPRGSEFTILTKKPIVAGDEERANNPRSRSAKLRALRRDPRCSNCMLPRRNDEVH